MRQVTWKRASMLGLAVAGLLGVAGPMAAQNGKGDLAGTWKLEKGKVEGNGPRTVIIRADSSASWGEEMVRWRLRGESIMIALGGEWEIYKIKIRGNRITLSGPDLPEDVTLRRVGPATPRPADVPVPPDPDLVGAR
ncbi:MAG: hypothetical protein R2909_05235 [Gemmatimonadales bacterium]